MTKKVKIFYLTNSASATQKIGSDLSKAIMKIGRKGPIIIGLDGDLGSGKTTFLQGFAKGLGIKEKILSPTFVILKHFKIPQKTINYKLQTTNYANFYHFDCYRINKPGEILELNFQKIISIPENIVVIEWAERIKKVLPKNMIIINFKFLAKNKRQIVLSGIGLSGTIKNNG